MEKNTYANPAPLGLLGFGMTTVLLNLVNAGILDGNSIVIVAMGIALGGTAQIIAGILEFKKGNTFGMTAFTAYGLFWWSLVLIWVNPFGKIAAASPEAMGFYLGFWGIFTLFMFVGTLKHSVANRIVFCLLTLLFFLLSAHFFAESATIGKVAGYVGIVCGLSAMYNAFAQVVNNEFGKKILPL